MHSPLQHSQFLPTRWTVVLAAARNHPTPSSRQALEDLARAYWYPLYVYTRRHNHSPSEAEDLTQDFFAAIVEKQTLAAVDPAKGRFRSFLLACLKNFLANQRDKARAQKRGGTARLLSIDTADAESRYAIETAGSSQTLTPEQLYERRWALALLDQVLARLQADYALRNESALFTALKPTLTGSPTIPYAHIAQTLNTTEPAIKTAAHRLRRRYRDLLREHIAHTVATESDIEDEITHLLNSL
jgi:RNA polymerase sigma factor (sigma-70 family)